jgi:hypothetical protein
MDVLMTLLVIVLSIVVLCLNLWIVRLIRQRHEVVYQNVRLRQQLDASVIRLDEAPEQGKCVTIHYQTEFQPATEESSGFPPYRYDDVMQRLRDWRKTGYIP